MFDSSYSFRYCSHTKPKGQYNVITHILTFNCNKNHQYIVNVEQYPHSMYAIKFYLKNHRLSDKKYKFITGLNDQIRVLATCIEIMLYFYNKNHYASFAIIGESSLDENTHNNTKRFRVYKRILENLFSPFRFLHLSFPNESAYILVNKDKQVDNLPHVFIEMFNNEYPIDLAI